MTTPKPLSPAARAVKAAFWGYPGNWDALLGAALRALAENHGTPASGGAVILNGDDVLAIATELERYGGASTTADIPYAVGTHQPELQAGWQPIDPGKEAMANSIARELRRPDV